MRIFLIRTPYQLTSLTRFPAVNALLVHSLTEEQGFVLCGNSLADVDVVNAIAEPDADVSNTTQGAMDNCGNFFRGTALNAFDANLPASLIFNDFAVA